MKKVFALVLALCMMLSCCGALAEVSFPLEEEVTLTAFVLGMSGGVDYTDNYVTQWIKEKTNVNIDFTYAVSGDDGKTKLNLMIYSGEELPDIFIATGWTKAECALYGAEGVVIPLNEYLEDCENWNRFNEECPGHYEDLVMSDGNIYTYGDVNECFHCTHQARMWIYQPWVDSLNDGVLPTDKIVSAINVIFSSGSKTSELNIANLGSAYFYGEATMTINVTGATDWSYKAVTVEDFNGGAEFTFTYDGVKYTLTFAIENGTGSGSLSSSPTYTFSSEDKAVLYVAIGKVA